MRIYYSITTIDPVIVSQNNATTNNHECLDYIPGSAILGAIAARLYSKLDDDLSWQAFHSGQTRFSPCYAVTNNQLALPTPASWHFAKGKEAISQHKYNWEQITNHASSQFKREDGVQYKQCRDGYLNASGASATIKKGLTTKTAIDASTGIAKDASLFSYTYLEAGQTFVGWIDSDNEQLLNDIESQLAGDLRIGRSRNTEFGRVKIEIIETPRISEPHNNEQQIVLWCLSDCECLSHCGLPTHTPELATLIKAAKGSLNGQLSFIRSSRISRFNQTRQGLDTEQLLIGKGSVLVYDLDSPIPQEQLNHLAEHGIGINKQQGLGWVMVNPNWASEVHLPDSQLFDAICIPEKTSRVTTTTPTSVLTRWVESRVSGANQALNNEEKVKSLLQRIGNAYRNARQYNNILHSYEAGPSSSQWRRITDELRQNNNQWQKVLFDNKHGICKAQNDELGWGITWDNGEQLINFAEFIKQSFAQEASPVVLSLLARINRYDLSTYRGLKKAANELGFSLLEENNIENQGANA